jgi:hypothetical protein
MPTFESEDWRTAHCRAATLRGEVAWMIWRPRDWRALREAALTHKMIVIDFPPGQGGDLATVIVDELAEARSTAKECGACGRLFGRRGEISAFVVFLTQAHGSMIFRPLCADCSVDDGLLPIVRAAYARRTA